MTRPYPGVMGYGADREPTIGVAVLDFGPAPGSSATATVVTNQFIALDSIVSVWIDGLATTADHNAYEHSLLPRWISVSAVDLVEQVGFTLTAFSELRLTGKIAVHWAWA